MSLLCLAASTQYLRFDTIASGTVPFTVGFWFNPIDSNGTLYWSLGASGSDQSFYASINGATHIFNFSYYNGGSDLGLMATGAPSVNTWQYILMRQITSSSRRVVTWTPGAAPIHAADTTSITPTTLSRESLGIKRTNSDFAPANARFGEFFHADIDVQPDGAQIDFDRLQQLAYHGPFSIPQLAGRIVEYLPLIDGPYLGKIYQRGGPRSWIPINGPTMWQHPPLMMPYPRPRGTGGIPLII